MAGSAPNAVPFFYRSNMDRFMRSTDASGKIAVDDQGREIPIEVPVDVGRALPVTYLFGASSPLNLAVQGQTIDVEDCGLNSVQGVYIDNSQNNAPVTITLNGMSGQSIVARPFSQGFYRLLASPQMLDYTITCYQQLGSIPVKVLWLNLMPDGGDQWQAVVETVQVGQSVGNSSGTVANALATAAIPAVAGRTTYVTGFEVTASGSTAGLAVDVTLTNILGAGFTYVGHYSFVFPIGVLVLAQPLIVEFNPPLQIGAGVATTLTLPAGGLGNTNAAVNLHGFLI
jgi:hypothetical protein